MPNANAIGSVRWPGKGELPGAESYDQETLGAFEVLCACPRSMRRGRFRAPAPAFGLELIRSAMFLRGASSASVDISPGLRFRLGNQIAGFVKPSALPKPLPALASCSAPPLPPLALSRRLVPAAPGSLRGLASSHSSTAWDQDAGAEKGELPLPPLNKAAYQEAATCMRLGWFRRRGLVPAQKFSDTEIFLIEQGGASFLSPTHPDQPRRKYC